MIGRRHRITSYNVCYTKLLRSVGNSDYGSMGIERKDAREFTIHVRVEAGFAILGSRRDIESMKTFAFVVVERNGTHHRLSVTAFTEEHAGAVNACTDGGNLARQLGNVVAPDRFLFPDDEGNVAGDVLRITSYNVCYTKLLRAWTTGAW